jgi:hypothetical protein
VTSRIYSLFVMWLAPLTSWISTRRGRNWPRNSSCVFGFETVLNLHSIGSTIQVGRTYTMVFPPVNHFSSTPYFWNPLQLAIEMRRAVKLK